MLLSWPENGRMSRRCRRGWMEKLRGKVENMERKPEGVMKWKDTGEGAVEVD